MLFLNRKLCAMTYVPIPENSTPVQDGSPKGSPPTSSIFNQDRIHDDWVRIQQLRALGVIS